MALWHRQHYRIVNTDNFNGDYPDERFVGGAYGRADEAQAAADKLNDEAGKHAPRYYKVVTLPYTLQPGFEP